MKGMFMDDSISNLTSASNEASLSSSTMYPQQSFASIQNNQEQLTKKKRNLPGNPDPEAEVIALSPRALMATNRFICEICNKGFQRDQNLQLHRRGHNLPWKLKQRANKEVIRKKVYVCPEASCVHHDPSRALGDLTGIKKHFCRKHGEKKWKCEKCSKRYAVQSDWKAHSKICGTREYRCDCGTLFSRRDSFITHRAFCDALAEESARSSALITPCENPILSSPHFNLQPHEPLSFQPFELKTEQEIPPWLPSTSGIQVQAAAHHFSSQLFSIVPQENPNPNPSLPSSHMSATALLQKAAQMGVTMSKPPHMSTTSGLCLSSCEERETGNFVHGMPPFRNNTKAVNVTSGCLEQVGATTPSSLYDMVSPLSYTSHGFGESSFEEAFDGMLNQKTVPEVQVHLNRSEEGGGGGDGLTRDFLGLRAFPHRDFLNMSGLDQISSSSYHHQNQNRAPL